MTDEQLKGIAYQALNMAKTELDQKGTLGMVFAACFEDGVLHRLADVESKIAADFGEDWMENSRKKDFVFAAIRRMVDEAQPTAVAFANMADQFVPTPLFEQRYPTPEQKKAVLDNTGHRDHHRMVEEGLFELWDVLSVTVQTPERMLTASARRMLGHTGPLVVRVIAPQAEFRGRTKMYGKEVV